MPADTKQSKAKPIYLRQPGFIYDARSQETANKPKSRFLILGLVLAVLISAVILSTGHQNNPTPKNIAAKINYNYFAPVKLPAGYSLLKNSFRLNKQILLFEINPPSGYQILVSEQKPPATFNVSTFQQKEILNKISDNTSYGLAYFGNLESSQIGSLVANGTWVFASQPIKAGSPNEIIAVFQSLSRF